MQYSIQRRKVGGSLIEANERMSVLLDKCDTQNLKMKTLGFTQSLRKVCDENKESEEKTTAT